MDNITFTCDRPDLIDRERWGEGAVETVFLIICIGLLIALVVSHHKRRQDTKKSLITQQEAANRWMTLKSEHDALQGQLEIAQSALTETHKSLSALEERFRPVIDAEDYAAQIRRKAASELNATQEKLLSLKEDTLSAERTLRALRNTIDGYSDDYILPTQSLLDDLAEAFGFDDAGKALKDARAHSTMLVKSGKAAVCDYVEENRRTSAINFVIDAFNGKVDTLQTRIKADNAGTLIQKVQDAATLVNLHGQAFRNARITPAYLAARQAEVKWGAVVQALKEKAREEQRALKEHIREEERARREYERAMKEAAKEEEKATLALEKARLAYDKARTDSERQKLEERIAEFEAQVTRAHERAQQAVSMAQLTKSGHVYIISNIGSFGDDVLKIGMTRRLDPMERVKELGDASVPFSFDVHGMIYSEDAVALEAELHRRFTRKRVNKVNFRKEFFRVGMDDIRQAAADLSLEAHFTILAAALEYRETLAIEHLPEAEQITVLSHSLKDWTDNPVRTLIDNTEDELIPA